MEIQCREVASDHILSEDTVSQHFKKSKEKFCTIYNSCQS